MNHYDSQLTLTAKSVQITIKKKQRGRWLGQGILGKELWQPTVGAWVKNLSTAIFDVLWTSES